MITGLNLGDVNVAERTILVMGKGRRQRQLPFGAVAAQALTKYMCAVAEHRAGDPLFISRTGKRMTREGIASAMRTYARRGGIQGVRLVIRMCRHQ